MSEAGKPCSRNCGATVYFDKNSPTGHPSPDKWIPLEIKEGCKTDVAHNCPKRVNGSSGTLDSTSTTATTTTAIIAKPAALETAEVLIEILEDYIRLKRSELEAAK